MMSFDKPQQSLFSNKNPSLIYQLVSLSPSASYPKPLNYSPTSFGKASISPRMPTTQSSSADFSFHSLVSKTECPSDLMPRNLMTKCCFFDSWVEPLVRKEI